MTADLVLDLWPSMSADEVAALFHVAAQEQQVIAELDACWERLRDSRRARARLQHLTPGEIHEALTRAQRALTSGSGA